MRPMSQALLKRLLRPDPSARTMVQMRAVTQADIRSRYDQFQALDSLPSNAELLVDGGVRLKATTANGPLNSTHGSTARTLLDAGPPTGPYIDPLSPSGLGPNRPTFDAANLAKARLAAGVMWSGSESADTQLTQIKAWLVPQFNTTSAPKEVSRWRCDLYALQGTAIDPLATPGLYRRHWTVAPIAPPIYADATGQGAGLVTFDFTTTAWANIYPQPKLGVRSFLSSEVDVTPGVILTGPVTIALFSGLRADGTPAANIGLGYDGAAYSASSAAGSYLVGFALNWDVDFNSPTQMYCYGTYGNGVPSSRLPAVQFILGSHTSATVTFGSAGNRLTLVSAVTPTFVGRGETPSDTSITYEASTNATTWTPYVDGDTATGIGLAVQDFYYVRATLAPNTAGDRSPILRALGVEDVSSTDLSDIAEVTSYSEAFDPLTHKAEIGQITVQAIHDGERDFQDRVHNVLSTYGIGDLSLRVSIGASDLTEDFWCHVNDFLIDDLDYKASAATITGVSPLALLRGGLPKFQPQVNAYPDGVTELNPNTWTASAGTTLWTMLADDNGGLGLLPWDDSTYILTPTNPSNAQYTSSIQSVGAPSTAINGQVVVQFRYALVTGTSLQLACALMEGATQRSSTTVTVNSSNIVTGVLTPTVTELAAITSWSNLRLRFSCTGTGSVKVTWARLAVLATQPDLAYSNQTPSVVAGDLLRAQIDIDDRYLGPNMAGIPGVGTGTTLLVGKTIDSPEGGQTSPTVAKEEVDALGFVAGGVFTASQGQIRYRQLYQVALDNENNATFEPLTTVPAAYIPKEEICEPISVSPGYRRRVPAFYVNWGFDEQKNKYSGTAKGFNDAALAKLGEAKITAAQWTPETVSRWIQNQGHANGLAFRHVAAFGLGVLVWRFRSTYAHPELEIGDTIAFEQDRFTAYDPVAEQGISGPHWVTGIVCGIFDPMGRDAAPWIPSSVSIGSA